MNPQRCKISQLFGQILKRCEISPLYSTAVHNSQLWPLDNTALLRNFATMRIYAICRTEWERKGFLLLMLFLYFKQSSKVFMIFSRWIGTLEQTSDIIRHNSKRYNSCVKLKNIGESFMMLLLKMDLSAFGFCSMAVI